MMRWAPIARLSFMWGRDQVVARQPREALRLSLPR